MAAAAIASDAIAAPPSGGGRGSLLKRLNAGEEPALVRLLEIRGRRIVQDPVDPDRLGAAIGGEAIAWSPLAPISAGAGDTLLLSDRDWRARPDDLLRPNARALALLTAPGSTNVEGPLYPEDERRAAATVASARAFDDDGILTEYLETHSIDAAEAVFSIVEEDGYSVDQIVFYSARVAGYDVSAGEFTFSFEPRARDLDKAIQTSRYNGLGGVGGAAGLAEQYHPVAIGECYNAPGDRADPSRLIFRWGRLDLDDVAPKDKGLPLAWSGVRYESYNELQFDADPAPGTYDKGPLGTVRLGDEPQGVVTADLSGERVNGVYVDRVRDAVAAILSPAAAADGRLDVASFSFLPDDKVGIFLPGDTEVTRQEVLDVLLAPYLAWVDEDPDGRVGVARLKDPRNEIVFDTLGPSDVLETSRVLKPDRPIRVFQEMTYGRNYRPLTIDELADPENPRFDPGEYDRLQKEYEIEAYGDRGLKGPFPTAEDGPLLPTFLVEGAAARRAAFDLYSALGQDFGLANIDVPLWRAARLQRGRTVEVNHPDVTGGLTLRLGITGIGHDPERDVTTLKGPLVRRPSAMARVTAKRFVF